MRIIDWLSRIALVLTFGIVLAATPVSAAELASSNAVLGALSGVGSVHVRGVALQEETTLFSGDRVRTGPGAYAKISLANGARVEVAGDSEFTVKSEGDKGIRLNVTSGSVAFTASTNPLIVAMSGHEVLPQAGARGQVAILPATDMADVRVFSGKVEVKNLATKGTVAIANGAERVVNLKTGAIETSTMQIASVAPSVPPAGMPAAAPPRAGGGSYAAMLGTLAGGAAAIGYVANMDPNRTPGAVLSAAQATALADVYSMMATAGVAVSAGAEITSLANLIASASPADAAQANGILAAANVTEAQILALNAQLLALANQISAITDPVAQHELLFALTQQVIAKRNQLNNLIDTLNAEIQQINALAIRLGLSNRIELRPRATPAASNSVP